VERLNLYDAIDQAKRDARKGEIPTVMHRKNHCEWLVTMPLDEWMKLYREWEAGEVIGRMDQAAQEHDGKSVVG